MLPDDDNNEPSFPDDGGESNTLSFDVSSGLKRVIGRDLITDDEVAIFELVKNSFDAGATNVQIRFQDDLLWVVDDGVGMSLSDIKDKWLQVAYSVKNSPSRDQGKGYREQIADRRHFAGSKGIGRFSADRLGSYASSMCYAWLLKNPNCRQCAIGFYVKLVVALARGVQDCISNPRVGGVSCLAQSP